MKKYRSRIYYTETDKAMMWDRWAKGESLNQIARLFDRHHGSIRGILARTGGIRLPTRRRSPLALSLAERERQKGQNQDGFDQSFCSRHKKSCIPVTWFTSYFGHIFNTSSGANGFGPAQPAPFYCKSPYRNESNLPTDRQLLVRDTAAMLISISHLTLWVRGAILTIDVTRQFMSR